MKHYIFIALMLLGLVACRQEEPIRTLYFDIQVGEITGQPAQAPAASGALFAPAAIKQDWAEGDQLQIRFGDYKGDPADLILTYNGSTWVAGHLSDDCWLQDNDTLVATYSSGMVLHSVGTRYRLENDTIKATIDTWKFDTRVQVVVRELEGSPEEYTLLCSQLTGGPATGWENADGVAFYFGDVVSQEANDYVFALQRTGETNGRYYATHNTLTTATNACKGIKMSSTKFEGTFHLAGGIKWAVSNASNGCTYSGIPVPTGPWRLPTYLDFEQLEGDQIKEICDYLNQTPYTYWTSTVGVNEETGKYGCFHTQTPTDFLHYDWPDVAHAVRYVLN